MGSHQVAAPLFFSFSYLFLAATAPLLLSGNADAARYRFRAPRARSVAGVPSICKRTDYLSICMDSAKKYHAGATAAGVTQSSIHAAIAHTVQAKAMISKMTASKGRSAMTRANLNVCKQVYGDAIDNLQTSLKNLGARSYADLRINLSAAMTDYGTCDDGFTETPGARFPLANVNSLLKKLASNNLALASLLK